MLVFLSPPPHKFISTKKPQACHFNLWHQKHYSGNGIIWFLMLFSDTIWCLNMALDLYVLPGWFEWPLLRKVLMQSSAIKQCSSLDLINSNSNLKTTWLSAVNPDVNQPWWNTNVAPSEHINQSAFKITLGCWVRSLWLQFNVTGTVSKRFVDQDRIVPSLTEHLPENVSRPGDLHYRNDHYLS